jgi:hypothetical protein
MLTLIFYGLFDRRTCQIIEIDLLLTIQQLSHRTLPGGQRQLEPRH